jgi:hypothetical protein
MLQVISPEVEGSGVDIASYSFLKKSLDNGGRIDTVAFVLDARE